MNEFIDHHVTKTKYKTQRNNVNPYTIEDNKYYDLRGKFLFDAKDFEKKEASLFDRSSKCFISSASMFCGALHELGYLKTDVDEVAYEIALDGILKKGETRFHWEAHKRLMNIFLKETDLIFDYQGSGILEILLLLKAGFPVMCSFYIKPWYPSGKGHLTLASGYRENSDCGLLGVFVKDPFGKLLTKYKDHNGDNSYLPLIDFVKAIAGTAKSPCHIGFVTRKK